MAPASPDAEARLAAEARRIAAIYANAYGLSFAVLDALVGDLARALSPAPGEPSPAKWDAFVCAGCGCKAYTLRMRGERRVCFRCNLEAPVSPPAPRGLAPEPLREWEEVAYDNALGEYINITESGRGRRAALMAFARAFHAAAPRSGLTPEEVERAVREEHEEWMLERLQPMVSPGYCREEAAAIAARVVSRLTPQAEKGAQT